MSDKSGATALVTGANRGIGREVARQLAELGHAVLLTARDETQAQAAAAEIAGETGVPVRPLALTCPIRRAWRRRRRSRPSPEGWTCS